MHLLREGRSSRYASHPLETLGISHPGLHHPRKTRPTSPEAAIPLEMPRISLEMLYISLQVLFTSLEELRTLPALPDVPRDCTGSLSKRWAFGGRCAPFPGGWVHPSAFLRFPVRIP